MGEELKPGSVVWHSSDEDGLPDVGVSLNLTDGAELWCGDISRKLWEGGGPEIAELGDDGGSWLVVFGPGNDTTVVGKVEFYSGRALLEHVLAPIIRTQSTRIAELEEALRPFAEACMHLHPSRPDDGVTLDGFSVSDFRRASSVLSKGED